LSSKIPDELRGRTVGKHQDVLLALARLRVLIAPTTAAPELPP
jgi:hypothetical protein